MGREERDRCHDDDRPERGEQQAKVRAGDGVVDDVLSG